MAAAGPALHPGLLEFAGVLADALRADDRPLAVPAARRGRGADQQPPPRQHRRWACRPRIRRCLRCCATPATAPRWSASGTSAIRRTSARWTRATRSSSARCAAASTTSRTAIRRGAARPVRRRGRAPTRRLPDRPDHAARGGLASSAGPAASAPFFLSLHYTAPHWPWETRDDARAGAAPEGQPVPPGRRQRRTPTGA